MERINVHWAQWLKVIDLVSRIRNDAQKMNRENHELIISRDSITTTVISGGYFGSQLSNNSGHPYVLHLSESVLFVGDAHR